MPAKKPQGGIFTKIFDGVEKAHKISKKPWTSKSTKDGYYPKKRKPARKKTAAPASNYRSTVRKSIRKSILG